MNLSKTVRGLVDARETDKVESAWMDAVERDPSPTGDFLEAGKILRKAGERAMSETLLELLAEAQKEKGLWHERLETLKELARLSKRPASLRDDIIETLEKGWGTRKNYARVVKVVGLDGDSPADKAAKIESWLNYEPGQTFFMTGRGVGIVTELNPELGVARLDFESEKNFPVPLGAAPRFLEPVSESHVLRRRFTDEEAVRREAADSPREFIGKVLSGFGRPMTQSELKDAMLSVLPASKWTSWWATAKKNPRVVMSGKGAKATYAWAASTEAADERVLARFAQAKPAQKMKIARRESGRNAEVADKMADILARDAEKLAERDPAAAWEILATLEKLPGQHDTELDPDQLLLDIPPARITSGITERSLREKAIGRIAEISENPARALEEIFFSETDSRVLTLIFTLLDEGDHEAVARRVIEQTLRYPRRFPRAFMWFANRADSASKLPERADYNMIYQLNELLSSEMPPAERLKVKEFFDKGRLAMRIIGERDQPEEARRLHAGIDRFGQLEPFRRETLKAAIEMKHPSVRDVPEDEPIVALASSIAQKRDELERIRNVEIPATLKQIKEAREMGDLRENFEYKAARDRQEYLASRVAALTAELSRVRVLDPATIDTRVARPGTSLLLKDTAGEERRISILGPWESDPDKAIYSLESEAAKKLLGQAVGSQVSLFGIDYEIISIDPWQQSA